MVELVGRGSVINGPTMSSLSHVRLVSTKTPGNPMFLFHANIQIVGVWPELNIPTDDHSRRTNLCELKDNRNVQLGSEV